MDAVGIIPEHLVQGEAGVQIVDIGQHQIGKIHPLVFQSVGQQTVVGGAGVDLCGIYPSRHLIPAQRVAQMVEDQQNHAEDVGFLQGFVEVLLLGGHDGAPGLQGILVLFALGEEVPGGAVVAAAGRGNAHHLIADPGEQRAHIVGIQPLALAQMAHGVIKSAVGRLRQGLPDGALNGKKRTVLPGLCQCFSTVQTLPDALLTDIFQRTAAIGTLSDFVTDTHDSITPNGS